MINKILSLVHRVELPQLTPPVFSKSPRVNCQAQSASKPAELQVPLLAVAKTLGFSHLRPSRGKW